MPGCKHSSTTAAQKTWLLVTLLQSAATTHKHGNPARVETGLTTLLQMLAGMRGITSAWCGMNSAESDPYRSPGGMQGHRSSTEHHHITTIHH
jgi:hypothetical protein